MEITPEWAKNVLESKNNLNPRKVRKATVANYARQMAQGNWHESWDAITFDIDGNLINGQHRLLAVVKSNVTIVCFVITDAENITGDTGLKRSVVEELKCRGLKIENDLGNPYGVGVIRNIVSTYFGLRNIPSDEVRSYSLYPGIIKSKKIISALSGGKPGIKTAAIVSAITGGYIVTKDERCVEFAEILSKGFGESKSTGPVIALRDFLINNKTNTIGTSTKKKDAQIYTQTALRTFLNGGTAKRLIKADSLVYTPNEEAFKEEW